MNRITNISELEEIVDSYFFCSRCGKKTNGQYKLKKQIVCAACYKKYKGEKT